MATKSILAKAKKRIDNEASNRSWYGHIGYCNIDGDLGLAITITRPGGKSALTRMLRDLGLDDIPRSVRVVTSVAARKGNKRAVRAQTISALRKKAAARLAK